MVKRRSKNILKSKNIRNKRSKIRRIRKNRRRTNLKRKTKNIKKHLVGGEPPTTIREIYENFLKYNNIGYGKWFPTSEGDYRTIRGGIIPDGMMLARFKDILKNVTPHTYTGNEEMYEKFDKNDERNDVKKKIYEIFGFDSVEEFEENRERLRKEYEKEFNNYIPRVPISKEFVYDYGILNQTTEKPTFLNYGRGYNPHLEFENIEGNTPPTIYKVNPSLRGFYYQNEELPVERDMTDTNPDLERLYESRRRSKRLVKEKVDQMTKNSIDKKMKYFAGGGK